MNKLKRIKDKVLSRIPKIALVFYFIGFAAVILYVMMLSSESFANTFNTNVSHYTRMVFAKVTGVLPFSLAEAVLFTLPVILFLILRGIFKYMERHEYGFSRALFTLFGCAFVMFAVFVFNFGAGYRTPGLDIQLGYEIGNVSEAELKDTVEYVIEKISEISDELNMTEDGSIRGYTHSETVDKAYASYEKLTEDYEFIRNFNAPVKRLAISKLMTYTHISGVYTFFTGEANLNTNYPEFVNVFTIAHEMAHQRGIARENEANFVAYLVCINSDDSYMQYAGYLNMFEYLADSISDSKYKKELYNKLDSKAYYDLVKYSEFFDTYRDSTASDVAGTINDTYLQIQGTEGVKSYGMVVDLAVKYHKENRP